MSKGSGECVKVVVRCRPLNSKETSDGRVSVVEMDERMGMVALSAPQAAGEPPKTFTFDAVFPPNTPQEAIYKQTAAPICDSVLEGYNGTIFAYGQTGTGKTFTMEGMNDPPELKGLIPRAFNQVFDSIATKSGESTEFLVRASYLEIYNEEIRDLLSKNSNNKLDLKETPDSGVFVKDLTSYVVKSTRECDKLRDFGAKNRHVGATAMNQDSSRSHSLYTITVESCETRADGTASIRMGKLNLVDLAGSERQSKTQASGDRLKEATKINLSLSALGNVISALVDGKSQHIPYRDSKLTRLLMDSLGGNTKTVMVANMGPADYNYDESISTLRYANRAKNIKNKPKINEDPKDAMLREFQEEIARLKARLGGGGGGGGGGVPGAMGAPGERRVVERVVDVEVEKIVEVEKPVEVERVVEVVREVEVEKVVEVERVVERMVEQEVVREVVREVAVPVERVVEKVVGMREEEVEQLKGHMMLQAEREKQSILDRQVQDHEEMIRHRAEHDEMREREVLEEEERVRVQAELEALQAKIMHGGEHVRDRVVRQQRELEEKEKEIAEQQQREVQLRQEMEARQEARLAQEEQHSSLQEEVDVKSRKLKQLWAKFRAAQGEVADLQAEQQQQKEDLLLTVRELTRQLQLQNLVIESFVPPEEVELLEGRAVWDDDGGEEWRLLPRSDTRDPVLNKRPVSHPALLRPMSMLTRERARDPQNANNPRYRADNVLTFDLDMPERTTADYETDVNPSVRAALTAALQDDEQLELDTEENLPTMGPEAGRGGWIPGQQPAAGGGAAPKKKVRKKKAVGAADDLDSALGSLLGLDGAEQQPAEDLVPKSRGLVGQR